MTMIPGGWLGILAVGIILGALAQLEQFGVVFGILREGTPMGSIA
jgi:hypothetical protein